MKHLRTKRSADGPARSRRRPPCARKPHCSAAPGRAPLRRRHAARRQGLRSRWFCTASWHSAGPILHGDLLAPAACCCCCCWRLLRCCREQCCCCAAQLLRARRRRQAFETLSTELASSAARSDALPCSTCAAGRCVKRLRWPPARKAAAHRAGGSQGAGGRTCARPASTAARFNSVAACRGAPSALRCPPPRSRPPPLLPPVLSGHVSSLPPY